MTGHDGCIMNLEIKQLWIQILALGVTQIMLLSTLVCLCLYIYKIEVKSTEQYYHKRKKKTEIRSRKHLTQDLLGNKRPWNVDSAPFSEKYLHS